MKAKLQRKYRSRNPENKSGVSWRILDDITVEADTIEEFLDKVYNYPLPDKFDSGLEAVSTKGYVKFSKDVIHRKTIQIDVFRDYKNPLKEEKE